MIRLHRTSASKDRYHSREYSGANDKVFPLQVCRFLLRIGTIAFSLLIGSIGLTEAKLLASYGDWQAYTDVVNKLPRCGITNGSTAQHFQVYYQLNDTHLSLQIGSNDWSLPEGKTYEYKMQFDEADAWSATATSGRYTNDTSYVDVNVGADQLAEWLKEFKGARYLVLTFPRSNVRPWVLDLEGTQYVVQPFFDCLDVLLKRSQ